MMMMMMMIVQNFGGSDSINNISNMYYYLRQGFPGGGSGNESTCQCRNVRDGDLLPSWGRSPGVGSGNLSSILAWGIPWTEEPGGL